MQVDVIGPVSELTVPVADIESNEPVDSGEQLVAPEPEPTPFLVSGELFSPTGVELLPLWDERWPAPELAKVRDRGIRAFERAFGQKPITDDEALFPASVVNACTDGNRSFTLGSLPALPKARWQIVAGIDPSSGSDSKLSAYWVLLVLAIDQTTGHKFVIWIEDHKRIIRAAYDRHRWAACNLERNNVQRLLLAPYKTTGAPMQLSQTTAEKHFQLQMIADEMHAGKLHIPSSPRVQPLLDELKGYPLARLHDCIEALRLAWLLADTPRKGSGAQCFSLNLSTGRWSS
jgi:hypothetical protein